MHDIPEISIVLPCYRSGDLARRSLQVLQGYLPRHFPSWEVVVVDDGGGDLAADLDRSGPGWRIRFLRLPRNRGKGAAVRAGMAAARGQVRLFTDVDLPYDLDVIPFAASFIRERHFHLAIGDRTLVQSSYTLRVGWRRRLASTIFSKLVGTLLTGGFFDTQCGLKAFRDDVAEVIFGQTRIDRYALDVELIYLALRARTDIKRVPVVLRNNETSAIRLLRDSLRMMTDVARIRLHAACGGYPAAPLAAIVGRDLDAARDGCDGALRPPAAAGARTGTLGS
jgi:dolichyl-phosphate beta-glucosyltransferase